MTWNNVQPPCNTCVHCAQSSQYHGNHLGSKLPHAAYLHPQVAILGQLLSMLPTDVAIGRTADVNEKAGVSLLVSEKDVRSVGFDLPCSGDGRIPHHYLIIIILNYYYYYYYCVVTPLHEWATGSLPQLGTRQPGRKVPAGYMFLCSHTAISDYISYL